MITLRPARDLDAGCLGDMLTRGNAMYNWKPRLHSAAEDVAHLGQMIARGWVKVAMIHDQPQGFIARDGAYIHALFTHPDAQRQGIARALLHDAMQHSDTLDLWTFTANTGAQQLYFSQGFTEQARTDGSTNDEGLPDIRYQWARKNGTAGGAPLSNAKTAPSRRPNQKAKP